MHYLGMSKDKVEPVADQLNQVLACYQVYYQNLRNFHWNIKGKNFFDLHALFEDFYNAAQMEIDEVAERLLTIRFRPLSSLAEYLETSKIEEAGVVDDSQEMVRCLLSNHGQMIQCMRDTIKAANEIGDEATIDLIAGYLRTMEKRSWMMDQWIGETEHRMAEEIA